MTKTEILSEFIDRITDGGNLVMGRRPIEGQCEFVDTRGLIAPCEGKAFFRRSINCKRSNIALVKDIDRITAATAARG